VDKVQPDPAVREQPLELGRGFPDDRILTVIAD